jgi:CBS domain-containing protein
MKVRDLMTREVVTVPTSASLKEAARLLVKHGISGLPVVESDRLVGVLSERDLLFKERQRPDAPRWLGWLTDPVASGDRPKLDAHVVGEAMSSPAVTVNACDTVSSAAKEMLAAGVSRLPVVEDGKLVGIVTRADLIRAFVRTDLELAREIHDDIIVRTLWLDERTIHVEVQDGAVTLTGELDGTIDDEMLVRLVSHVPGVTSVRTRVEVA